MTNIVEQLIDDFGPGIFGKIKYPDDLCPTPFGGDNIIYKNSRRYECGCEIFFVLDESSDVTEYRSYWELCMYHNTELIHLLQDFIKKEM